jgi:hypothetical protein
MNAESVWNSASSSVSENVGNSPQVVVQLHVPQDPPVARFGRGRGSKEIAEREQDVALPFERLVFNAEGGQDCGHGPAFEAARNVVGEAGDARRLLAQLGAIELGPTALLPGTARGPRWS